MGTIVEAQRLVKRFNGLTAVADVSFAIHQGEIFSLLGPNGAGKTTTISILSGLLAPTAGDAQINGHSITRQPMAVKKEIGVVPQEIALYNQLSARQNLLFWGRLYNLGGQELRRRVDELLERIGLSERADDRVETYSGGMKRRVNIAAGLLHRPRVVFMDEPTVGIDPQSRRNILDMIKELNREGMTILYTTHYMEEAQELSDRVGIMDHGQLIALGGQRELTRLVGENETLRLHLGDEESLAAEKSNAALAEALELLPAVAQASAVDGQVIVMTPNAAAALPAVFAKANELGFPARSVDIEEPNLEAVFLHLTGRALRD